MPKPVRNVTFITLLGIILGATILTLYMRISPLGEMSVGRHSSAVTERMIEEGALSAHEATYYKIEGQGTQDTTP